MRDLETEKRQEGVRWMLRKQILTRFGYIPDQLQTLIDDGPFDQIERWCNLVAILPDLDAFVAATE